MEHTPLTHSTMEKQTQEGLDVGVGWGGTWEGVKRWATCQKRGSSTSRVQNVPKVKSGHPGHTQRLGDSEKRFSIKRLILPVAPLRTGSLFFHIFLRTCFFLG